MNTDFCLSKEGNDHGNSLLRDLMYIHMGLGKSIQTMPSLKLQVPWQKLQQDEAVNSSALLSWHSGLSPFIGRDKEMGGLEKWALSPQPVSAQWITGAGGIGKSRLAAEFSDHMMEKHDWACGFVELCDPKAFALDKKGLLIVIDYPEEKKESVQELLLALVDIDQKMPAGKGQKIRVLFLSRQKFGDWQQSIFETGAEALVNPVPLELSELSCNSAKEIYTSSVFETSKIMGKQGCPIREGLAESWVQQSKENGRPQFIVAAAVFSAIFPDEDIFLLDWRQIIKKLAHREISRAEEFAASSGLKEPSLFPIFQAMSNMGGGFKCERAGRVISAIGLGREVTEDKNLLSICNDTDLSLEGLIGPISPDIFAAAYTVEVLKRRPLIASKIIWLSLENNLPVSLFRLSRLCYDAEVELGFDKKQLDHWLVEAISEAPDRGPLIEPFLVNDLYGLNGTGIKTCRICLERAETETGRMRLFDKISLFFKAFGDLNEALKQRVFGVDICEKLASDQPEIYEPTLAQNYFDLWEILCATGEKWKAYKVIERTAELYEKLASVHPRKLKMFLANSLEKLGNAHAEVGELEMAVTATEKAMEVYEQLALAQPQAFGPAMATCLNSQGHLWSRLGGTEKAIMATRDAVNIYEQLTKAQPENFESELAASLTNLGNRYIEAGETKEAFKTIRRALEIYEKLVLAHPEVFEADLAGCLSIEGNLYAFLGETEKALEITQRVVDFYSKLAEETSVYDSLLASALNNLSSRYAAVGEDAKALQASDTAVNIYESLVEAYPIVFDPHLATSLNTLGLRYAAVGDNKKALSATQRAIEIYSQLVAAQPEVFEPDMAGCLNNQGNLFAQIGEWEKALVAIEMAVNIKEQLASADPQKFIPSLVKSLNNLEQRYTEIGEEEKARIIRERAKEFQEKYANLLS